MKELEYPFDVSFILKKKRKIKKDLLANSDNFLKKRIAILGGSTTEFIKQSLDLFLLNNGIEATFYESDYNHFYEDAVFANPRLDEFKPDLIYVCTSIKNITNFPKVTSTKEENLLLVEEQVTKFKQIWDSLSSKYHVPIVQNNFEKPYFRLLGNMDNYDHRGYVNFINRINFAFAENASNRDDLFLVDLDYISSDYGLKKWSDPFYWHMYKCAVSVEATPFLSFNVANIIKAIYGKNKKGFVLDLDNTLWGGVIGDDGVNGIRIGHEDTESQAFFDFQNYLKLQKEKGIILTVNSKNDEQNAIEGLNHVEGVLRPDDFAVIKANWNSKDQNFKEIAAELNILPESLVFVDDNPAERHIVSSQLDSVSVVELTDVAHYIEFIDRSGFFETVSLSSDDINRNEMYKENAQRAKLQGKFNDYGEYLDSLEMKAQIRAFEPMFYSRISQLSNKSNQFNLTTKRYSQSQIETIANSSSYLTLYGKLEDRFGDNGVVSVIVGKIEAHELHIDLWLMSCRVLKRDMEKAMFDSLIKESKALGLTTIYGYYFKTDKNSMVKDLLSDLGFTKVEEKSNGDKIFVFDNIKDYKNQNHHISVIH